MSCWPLGVSLAAAAACPAPAALLALGPALGPKGTAAAGEAAASPATAWPAADAALLALLAPLPEQPASAAIAMIVSPAGSARAMSVRPQATLCVVRMPLGRRQVRTRLRSQVTIADRRVPRATPVG